MSTEAAPYVVELEREVDRLRASLTTAEKERDEALRLVGMAEDAYAGSVICHEILAFMEAAGCGRPGVPNTLWAMTKELIARTQAAEDAASAANKASDSSALEKALGALRAIDDLATQMRERLATYKGDRWYPKVIDYTLVINHKCRTLSGGAHVDGPKAPSDE